MPDGGTHLIRSVSCNGTSDRQAEDVTRMLQVVGAPSLGRPDRPGASRDIRQAQPLDLGAALSEHELLAKMRAVGARNGQWFR